MNWLLAPHNTLFAAAFMMLLCFALLEGISLVLGLGLSDWLSDLLNLPDGDADAALPDAGNELSSSSGDAAADADSDADTDSQSGHGGGFLSALLSWLEIGKVPVLISLCAFLAAFSIGGMMLQQALILAGIGPVAWPLSGTAAFLAALPVMKFSNRMLGRIWPQDETSAFPEDHLLGRVGTVTIGTATRERAAEVRVTGPDGRQHYVMCAVTGDSVAQGGEILLQSRNAATGHFLGTRNTDANLSPELYS